MWIEPANMPLIADSISLPRPAFPHSRRAPVEQVAEQAELPIGVGGCRLCGRAPSNRVRAGLRSASRLRLPPHREESVSLRIIANFHLQPTMARINGGTPSCGSPHISTEFHI